MPDSKKPEVLMWAKQYPIVDEDHAAELDAAAGAHEFHHGLRRQDAEHRAHQDYTRSQALEAAAHHLLGVRAAHAVGSDESAMLHGAAFAHAMKAAGHEPFGEVPAEVLDRAVAMAPKAHSFKGHRADNMFQPAPEEAKPAHQRMQDLMTRLKSVGERVSAAAAAEEKPE
jgi:hypothetical protein